MGTIKGRHPSGDRAPPAAPSPPALRGPAAPAASGPTSPADAAVWVKDLRKDYDDIQALRGVSFAVRPGEVYGLLGPNGAGKTTLQQILCTLLRPTSGEASIGGASVRKQADAVRRKLGVVFQERSLDRQMTARQNLVIHGRLYKVSDADMRTRIPELLEVAQLTDRSEDKVATFSGGMKRRLELARAMLHDPEVLLLDEPTTGLDPQSRRLLWKHLGKLKRERGITVLLTTHYMDEADALCDRLAIIDHGLIVSEGTPASLKDRMGGDRLDLVLGAPADGVVARLAALPNVVAAAAKGSTLEVRLRESGATVPRVLQVLHDARIPVLSLQHKALSMDDVFIGTTGAVRDRDRKKGRTYPWSDLLRRFTE